MSELLLELYTEEIPAKHLLKGSKKALEYISKQLLKQKLINKSEDILMEFTPNRLLIYSRNISSNVANIKGPKNTAQEIAINAFMRKYNINNLEDLEQKNDYYYYVPKNNEEYILKIITEIINQLLSYGSNIWDNKMKWNIHHKEWIRPIKNILALFNNRIINCQWNNIKGVDYTLPSKKYHMENQFNSTLKKVKNIDDYFNIINEEGIIISYKERQENIRKSINEFISKNEGLHILTGKDFDSLIEENANLTERPELLCGNICIEKLILQKEQKYKTSEIFNQIPIESLTHTMIKDQKYFPLFKGDNKLAFTFLFVAEKTTLRNEKAYQDSVQKGHEKVIIARLNDIIFFHIQDQKKYKNKNIQNIKELLQQKINDQHNNTLLSSCQKSYDIYNHLFGNKNETIINQDVFLFLKLDLISNLVIEIPELQGKIGSYYTNDMWLYLLNSILPKNSNDTIKSISEALYFLYSNVKSNLSKLSKEIIISHHLQYIAFHFSIGNKPTSSGDPYAVKRMGNFIAMSLSLKDNNADSETNLNFNILSKLLGSEISEFIIQRISYIWLKEYKEDKALKKILETVINDDHLYTSKRKYKHLILKQNLYKNNILIIIQKISDRILNVVKNITSNNEIEEDINNTEKILLHKITNTIESNKVDKLKEYFCRNGNKEESDELLSQILNRAANIIKIEDQLDEYLNNYNISEKPIIRRKNLLLIKNMIDNMFNL